jgi:hypothetical protein
MFKITDGQPDIEDEATDDKYRGKLLPASFPEKLAPAIEAIQHRNRKREIKRVGVG